jgi:glutathione synthase/RimK-type ligase-like ATP-grasp enzyme
MDAKSSLPSVRVALATCRRLPEPDPDERITLDGFRKAGHDAFLLPWDGGEFFDADVVLLRSTWNYPWKRRKFLQWVERAELRSLVLNPPAVVRWNLDKRYLVELSEQGIPTVPTVFHPRGAKLSKCVWDKRWREVVIKPTISAGSWLTRRFRHHQHDEALAFLQEKLRSRDMMVQPCLESVEVEGEHAIVWIDGELMHAIRKNPRFSDDAEHVSPAMNPTDEQRELALRVMSRAPGSPLYARIDLMRDDVGTLAVSELELIEPSLFFLQHPIALNRFVGAVQGRFSRFLDPSGAGRFEA